jgi:CBS domain-containing protein
MVEGARSWKHVKRVREVMMQRKVVTIAPEASLLLAARRMREHQIGCLPVLERGELLGMITDRDLVVRAFAEAGELAHLCVRDVMSAGVVSCSADQGVEEVEHLMREGGLSRLPVLNRRRRLVGLVSLRGIAGPALKPKPYRVVFYRRLTSSSGHPHDVSVAKVHLSPALSREEVAPAAIRRFERDHGVCPWDRLADRYEIAEGEGS